MLQAIGELAMIRGEYEQINTQNYNSTRISSILRIFAGQFGLYETSLEKKKRLNEITFTKLGNLTANIKENYLTALKTEMAALRNVLHGKNGTQDLVRYIDDALARLNPSTLDIEEVPRTLSEEALVFSLQKFCIHDGPGLRTTLFFKGCDLNCLWCQNPEGKSKEVGLEFKPGKVCSREISKRLVDICETKAISLGKDGRVDLDRSKCVLCGKCEKISDAFRMLGNRLSIEDLFDEIMKDKAYYDKTGGGVTLSGGEPLIQWEAAKKLLVLCKKNTINTVVETAGIVPWKNIEAVLPFVDLIYFDLKGAGDNIKAIVGMNHLRAIKASSKKLVDRSVNIEFRMVIVPGYNDSKESLDGIADFLLKYLKVSNLSLLKYSPGAEHKIKSIETDQPPLSISEEEAESAIENAAEYLKSLGLVIQRPDKEDKRAKVLKTIKRVENLKRAALDSPRAICLERDYLLTEYYRRWRHSKKSDYRMRAESLAYVLSNKKAKIYRSEILVGNYTTKKGGGGHTYPEFHGSLGTALNIPFINWRKTNSVKISFREMITFYTKIFPFWSFRNLLIKSFSSFREAVPFMVGQLKSDKYATPLVAGVSHFVPDYKKLLDLGTSGIIEEIKAKKDAAENPDFYESLEIVLHGLEDMAQNFAKAAKKKAAKCKGVRKDELLKIAEVCESVPKKPARNFQEALQAIVFCQIALVCETSFHGVGIGRIDQLLAPYYRDDEKEKIEELVQLFSIKLSEYSSVMPSIGSKIYSGLNNGQAADVGGLDAFGNDATNELSKLFIKTCLLGMKGPNLHARVHKGSPKDYMDTLSHVLADGSPLPSVFNEEVCRKALEYAHPSVPKDAIANFNIIGCTEIAPPSSFPDTDNALINIVYPLQTVLDSGFNPGSIDEVIDRYIDQLNQLVEKVIRDVQHLELGHRKLPTMLSSALIDGPVESGKDVNEGGAKYNSSGIQGVGLADVADSLYAIDQAVFKQKFCAWQTLIRAIKANFKGYDFLRSQLVNLPKYGNDCRDVDQYVDMAMTIFAKSLSRFENTRGGPYVAGWYSMTTHVHFGKSISALPNGRSAKEPLANGLSPSLSVERLGPTAALNSSAKLENLQKTSANGVIVNIMMHQLLLNGQKGVDIISGLIRGYFAQGGMQLQFNILDPKVLIDALEHPERHKDLIVRISGYAAYFNDLSPEMKNAIIKRTIHEAN